MYLLYVDQTIDIVALGVEIDQYKFALNAYTSLVDIKQLLFQFLLHEVTNLGELEVRHVYNLLCYFECFHIINRYLNRVFTLGSCITYSS